MRYKLHSLLWPLLVASIFYTSPAQSAIKILPATKNSFETMESWNDKSIWYAIIPDTSNKGLAHVKRVSLKLVSRPDGANDPLPIKLTGGDARATFYISGYALKDGARIQQYNLNDHCCRNARAINVGDTLQLRNDNKVDMVIAATGTIKWSEKYKTVSPSSYHLHAHFNGRAQTLLRADGFDDTAPALLWAGDLNADNIPDLMMNLSPKYSMAYYTLWLSNAATTSSNTTHEQTPLLDKRAEYLDYGC